jgi:hypothetical protein
VFRGTFGELGSIANGNNSIEEETKGRTSLGNKAFYRNQDLFKSKILSKKSKLPDVPNTSETSGNIRP